MLKQLNSFRLPEVGSWYACCLPGQPYREPFYSTIVAVGVAYDDFKYLLVNVVPTTSMRSARVTREFELLSREELTTKMEKSEILYEELSHPPTILTHHVHN